MTFVLFLAVFVIASQALAFAIALIARAWTWKTEQVVLRGIDVSRARELVAAHLESVTDTRFGFPTGVFRVDVASSGGGRLMARELNFSGSTALDLGRFAMAIPAAFVAEASDEGCAAGLIALAMAVVTAMFLVVPMLVLGVIEIVLRWLMRSHVVAMLEPLDAKTDACLVSFELSGLSAFGLRGALLAGLKAPVLPFKWGGPPASSLPREPWYQDRLNVVYACGSMIAATIAIVIVATSTGHRSASARFAYPAAASSPADETATPREDPEASGSEESSASGEQDTEAQAGTTDSEGTTSDESASPSTNEDLASSATHGKDFTIQRPAGDWVLDHFEVQKPGYIETRWHLAGTPDIIFLVDHTPGYAGTARQGAEGVSRLFKRVSSYRKLGFGPRTLPAGEAWRWEYEAHGIHSVDTFLMSCNSGYAARGATPASEWDQYSQTFEDAIATLTPSC